MENVLDYQVRDDDAPFVNDANSSETRYVRHSLPCEKETESSLSVLQCQSCGMCGKNRPCSTTHYYKFNASVCVELSVSMDCQVALDVSRILYTTMRSLVNIQIA